MNTEQERVAQNDRSGERWDLWGPYLSERAWGTVREDYSAIGDAWNYFPHEHARSRAYRWNEDGIGGISDFKQRLCFAFAFWNGRDPILKERFFGVTGPQGNHGEDVKELYWYIDNTPSHSFMRMSYRYPQTAFPYDQLVAQSAARSKMEGEFELWDTGALDSGFFDIEIEYAKADCDDILIRATATNRGPALAVLHLLPTIWFRNTWSWGRDNRKPSLQEQARSQSDIIEASHHALGTYHLYCEGADRLLFTENESNLERLWGVPNSSRYVKDSINDCVVQDNMEKVNPNKIGTKAAAHYRFTIPRDESCTIRLRLAKIDNREDPSPGDSLSRRENARMRALGPFKEFDEIFDKRREEADEFYSELAPASLGDEHKAIQRQALAGMLWSKQFYHYIVEQWLEGDPGQPPPPEERKSGRNSEWRHLYNERVMSMPDKWEYPWYASWDLAFHCIPLALVDPHFAKRQLDVIVREWYQHPNGQIPAYEWNFGDVNPPVIAWAAWRIYQIERKQKGKGDRAFLETIFHKMLIAFTWWVNRKDSEGNNIFQGGFLGLDNIGVFDRNSSFPDGSHLEQSDGTSWMGMFSLNMMRIAIELARENHVYENIATKFFEHFLGIAAAMNNLGGKGIGLWNEEDEFYYDVLHTPGGRYLAVEGAIARRLDAAARGGNDPVAIDRRVARIQSAARMVSDVSAGSRQPGLALAGAGHGRAPARRTHPRSSHEMFAATHARSRRISQRLRRAFCQQISPGASLQPDRARRRESRELRAGGIANRNFRRQFKLARPGLVSDQLSAHRVAPAISSLLRRRFQSGMPDSLGKFSDAQRNRERAFQSPD